MSNIIFQNNNFRVEIEPHEIPWVKIFTNESFKEMSELAREVRIELFDMADFIERDMIKYFNPNKINLASFGNYVPHVHLHIQARFEDDSFFPEPTWGIKQRDGVAREFNDYFRQLADKLEQEF